MNKLKEIQHLGIWKKLIFFGGWKTIKQMKRLQNPRMVDGDDRNDMVDIEDMEHQSEDVRSCVENHGKQF